MYLVLEDGGNGRREATVIDAGVSGAEKLIIKAAADAGAAITRIVLTHVHGDHVGGLDALAEALPEAEVLCSERTARFLSGDTALEPDEPQLPLKGGFPECKTQPTGTFAPGDRVGSLRVVASPGHSPDHVAFFDERDQTLVCGDAIQTKAGVAVAGVLKVLFPFPAIGTWAPSIALESARTLADLEPARLAPGHGRVLNDPVPAMRRAIAVAERKLR